MFKLRSCPKFGVFWGACQVVMVHPIIHHMGIHPQAAIKVTKWMWGFSKPVGKFQRSIGFENHGCENSIGGHLGHLPFFWDRNLQNFQIYMICFRIHVHVEVFPPPFFHWSNPPAGYYPPPVGPLPPRVWRWMWCNCNESKILNNWTWAASKGAYGGGTGIVWCLMCLAARFFRWHDFTKGYPGYPPPGYGGYPGYGDWLSADLCRLLDVCSVCHSEAIIHHLHLTTMQLLKAKKFLFSLWFWCFFVLYTWTNV